MVACEDEDDSCAVNGEFFDVINLTLWENDVGMVAVLFDVIHHSHFGMAQSVLNLCAANV